VAEFGIGTMVHTLLIFKISDEKVIDRVESVSEESGNDFFVVLVAFWCASEN
tara:strand:+ start:227 stop:382 length:156 start_codon:yes stop_codon:yes gene_type:complete